MFQEARSRVRSIGSQLRVHLTKEPAKSRFQAESRLIHGGRHRLPTYGWALAALCGARLGSFGPSISGNGWVVGVHPRRFTTIYISVLTHDTDITTISITTTSATTIINR